MQSNALSLRYPPAAGCEQPQPASDQQTEHHQQEPDRKEKQRQNPGVFGLGLQHPFDHADGRHRPIAPPARLMIRMISLRGNIDLIRQSRRAS